MKTRLFFSVLLVGLLSVAVYVVRPMLGAQEGRQQKLYVLSSAANDMIVIDVATNEIIASVDVGPLPHGLATPATEDILWVATEGDNTLVVVDPATDKVVKKYPVLGNRPNEIDITPDGRFVYVPIVREGVYEVFDTVKEEIVARIPTDGNPHNAVVSPDGKYMYFSPMGRNDKIYVADAITHTIVATIPTGNGNAPRPIAISPDGKRLYVNTDDLLGFVVLDLENRTPLSTAYYKLTDEEKAERSRSHGVVATPDGTEVWASDVNHELVFVFDVTQDPPKQIARFENPGDPYWFAVTPDGKTVYVSSATDDTITVYDVATKKQVKVIQLEQGLAPKRMQVVSAPKSTTEN